jgi:uncharacterized membrane protein YjgN (DUF898 family)
MKDGKRRYFRAQDMLKDTELGYQQSSRNMIRSGLLLVEYLVFRDGSIVKFAAGRVSGMLPCVLTVV